MHLCSCLFEAQKPFGPFLNALVGGSDFGAAPPNVAAASGAAAPPAIFSPNPEPGQYDDENDYRCPLYPPCVVMHAAKSHIAFTRVEHRWQITPR